MNDTPNDDVDESPYQIPIRFRRYRGDDLDALAAGRECATRAEYIRHLVRRDHRLQVLDADGRSRPEHLPDLPPAPDDTTTDDGGQTDEI